MMFRLAGKLKVADSSLLTRQTAFNKDELTKWYKKFLRGNSSESWTQADIVAIYAQFFPKAVRWGLGVAVHRAILSIGKQNDDGPSSGNITGVVKFPELSRFLSRSLKGTNEEKEEVAQAVLSADGVIDMVEALGPPPVPTEGDSSSLHPNDITSRPLDFLRIYVINVLTAGMGDPVYINQDSYLPITDELRQKIDSQYQEQPMSGGPLSGDSSLAAFFASTLMGSGSSSLVGSRSNPSPTARIAGRWTTLRVFISSTFVDMQGERDVLVKHVFPELNSRAKSRWVKLIPVDLRWGVGEEEAAAGAIQTTCLNEIDRCRPADGGLPWMVGLVGRRYGWVQTTFMAPEAFEYPQNARWLKAADKRPLSITTMELQHGVLQYADGSSLPGAKPPSQATRPHAFVYNRADSFMDQLPRESKWVFDLEYVKQSTFGNLSLDPHYRATPAWDGIVAERDRIKSELQMAASQDICRLRNYPCSFSHTQLTNTNNRVVGVGWVKSLEQFAKGCVDDMWRQIDTEFPPLPGGRDENAVESFAHRDVVDSRNKLFVGRKDLVEALMTYGGGSGSSGPLMVVGVPGAGKSALMARFIAAAESRFGQKSVVFHIVGATPSSTSLRALLRRLCTELQARLPPSSTSKEIPHETTKLRKMWVELLEQVAKINRVIVVVDAVNQLMDEDSAHAMTWLPALCPAGSRIIVTAAADGPHGQGTRCTLALKNHLGLNGVGSNEVVVSHMSQEERVGLVQELLRGYHKKLTDQQLGVLLCKPASSLPLYLVGACEELRVFGVYEQLTSYINALPGTVGGLFLHTLLRLERDHGRELVDNTMSLIAVSRGGLLEEEMIELLDLIPTTEPTISNFSRLYASLALFLSSSSSSSSLLHFFHHQLLFAVQRRYGVHGAGGERGADQVSAEEAKEIREIEQRERDRTKGGKPSSSVLNSAHSGDNDGDEDAYYWRRVEEAKRGRLREVHSALAAYFWGKCHTSLSSSDRGAIATTLTANLNDTSIIANNTNVERGFLHAVYHLHYSSQKDAVKHALTSVAFMAKKCLHCGVNALLDDFFMVLKDSNAGDLQVQFPNLNNNNNLKNNNNRTRKQKASTTTADDDNSSSSSHQHQPAEANLPPSTSSSSLTEILDFVLAQTHVLGRRPELLFQQALNYHQHSIVNHLAHYEALHTQVAKSWLAVQNKAQDRPPCILTLNSHSDYVLQADLSPDGRHIATCSFDKTIKIHDLVTGKEIVSLTGHTDGVCSVKYSKCGRLLLSGSKDRTARVWLVGVSDQSGSDQGATSVNSPANATQVALLTGHSNYVSSVCFSPFNPPTSSSSSSNTSLASTSATHSTSWTVVTGSRDKLIMVWKITENVPTNQLLVREHKPRFEVECLRALKEHTDDVICVTFSPVTPGLFASASGDRSILLWDIREMLGFPKENTKTSGIYAGNAVTSSKPKVARGKDEGYRVRKLLGHKDDVNTICFSRDGQKLASGSDDKSIIIWEVKTRKQLLHIKRAHDNDVTCVAFSSDARHLVSSSYDMSVKIWIVASGYELRNLTGHSAFVNYVVASPDDSRFYTASDDMTCKVWNPSILGDYVSQYDNIISTTTSTRGDCNSKQKKKKALKVGHGGGINCVAVEPDGVWNFTPRYSDRVIVTGCADGAVRACLTPSGCTSLVMAPTPSTSNNSTVATAHSKPLSTSSDFSLSAIVKRAPQNTHAVVHAVTSAMDDESEEEVEEDLGRKEEEEEEEEKDDGVCCVAISSDGLLCCSAGEDRAVRVWRVGNGRVVQTLIGHTAKVTCCAFDPTARFIVSGSWDKTLRLWDVESGHCVCVWRTHTSYINSLDLCPVPSPSLANASLNSAFNPQSDLGNGKDGNGNGNGNGLYMVSASDSEILIHLLHPVLFSTQSSSTVTTSSSSSLSSSSSSSSSSSTTELVIPQQQHTATGSTPLSTIRGHKFVNVVRFLSPRAATVLAANIVRARARSQLRGGWVQGWPGSIEAAIADGFIGQTGSSDQAQAGIASREEGGPHSIIAFGTESSIVLSDWNGKEVARFAGGPSKSRGEGGGDLPPNTQGPLLPVSSATNANSNVILSPGHNDTINDFKFSPSGRYLLSVGGDTLLVWDILSCVVVDAYVGNFNFSSVAVSGIVELDITVGDLQGRLHILRRCEHSLI